MYILFDLSIKDKIYLKLFDEDQIFQSESVRRNRELLEAVNLFLLSKKLKPEDLKGVAVVVGGGGFTSTRISTTVANSFAYVLKIPVLAIGIGEVDDLVGLVAGLKKQPIGQYISATYSAEPNIGKSK